MDSETLGVIVGLAMTVPSTNGANPGRNLLKRERGWNSKQREIVCTLRGKNRPPKVYFFVVKSCLRFLFQLTTTFIKKMFVSTELAEVFFCASKRFKELCSEFFTSSEIS